MLNKEQINDLINRINNIENLGDPNFHRNYIPNTKLYIFVARITTCDENNIYNFWEQIQYSKKKPDLVYVYNESKDISLELTKICQLYKEKIILKKKVFDSFELEKLLKHHYTDDVIIADMHLTYSQDMSYWLQKNVFNCVCNLGRDPWHACRVYNGGIQNIGTNTTPIKPSKDMMPCKNIYIPAKTFNNFEARSEDIEVSLSIQCIINEICVHVCPLHFFDDVSLKPNENILYNVLNSNVNVLELWKSIYPEYSSEICDAELANKDIDLCIMNYGCPELACETITISRDLWFKPKNIFMFDNSNYKDISMKNSDYNWILKYDSAGRNVVTNYIDNMDDKIFKREFDNKKDETHGDRIFEQTIENVCKKSKAQWIVIIRDKVIIDKKLPINSKCIWTDSDEIQLFNLEKMRQLNLEFHTFEQFKKDLDGKKEEFQKQNFEDICIFVKDVYKYMNPVFRNSRLRYYILRDELKERGYTFIHEKHWNY